MESLKITQEGKKPTNKHLTAEELGLLDALKKNDKEVDK